ncbi:YlaH-like family protein [Evansella tamaricis]|uniref:YlaH-like family protein n=1 Tax=Evansella tamaricis TaxID=2069301 RepID=A0ABS6JCG3_9BACI|nr:YlaH-like family protein [Evansella tamaricis]MBU9711266.1 YlaH-like family protein [Evansella tamaricis]
MIFLLAATSTPNPRMSPIAEMLGAGNPENFFTAFPIIYLIVNVLTIVVFNLGFARKLPILKLVVVYTVMFIGNLFITLLALTLPIVESLVVAAIVLWVYKLQLRRHKKDEAESEAKPSQ